MSHDRKREARLSPGDARRFARQFIIDRCIASPAGACTVLPGALFDSYLIWAKKKKVPAYETKGALVGALIDLGLMSTSMWLLPHGFDLPRVHSVVPEMTPES